MFNQVNHNLFKKKSFIEKDDQSQNKNNAHQLTSIKIIPLGGIGTIGGNATLIESHKEMILIDYGVLFPNSSQPGVDLILPDYTYILQNKNKLKAILITHGHEDHIGALPFLIREIPEVPIFSPNLALHLIKKKFRDRKIYQYKNLRSIQSGKLMKISSQFSIEYINVSHSIPDSFALAIHTSEGILVHTGDFKIDFSLPIGKGFDFHNLVSISQKKVLALLGDSTNVEKSYTNKTEQDVLQSIKEIVSQAKQRVFFVSFASNMDRVTQIIYMAQKFNKKVVILGRSMEDNIEICKKLGYIKVKPETLISPQEISKYKSSQLFFIMTGSQGESMSALTRIAFHSHKLVKIRKGDTVILSASIIPGNEKSVGSVINQLASLEVNIFYSRSHLVHVSGHSSKEQLQLMLHLVKPKYFIPIHGEEHHLREHKKLAVNLGMSPEHVLIPANGTIIEVSKKSISKQKSIPNAPLFVKDDRIEKNDSLILERSRLAQEGILSLSCIIVKKLKKIKVEVDFQYKGFIVENDPDFEKELKDLVIKTIQNHYENSKQALKNIIHQNIMTTFKKRGITLPFILFHIHKDAVIKKNNEKDEKP